MLTSQVITISYAISVAAYAVLALLLLTSWKGRLRGGLLLSAVGATVLWAAVTAAHARYPVVPQRWAFVAELARDAAWIAFLLQLVSERAPRRVVWLQWGVIGGLCALALWLIVRHPAPSGAPQLLIIVFVVLAVNGVLLIEQLYRNAQPDYRWRIKFLCVGLGGVMVYDLYMYSHALLVNSLDNVSWWSRGAINALAVPLLMVAAARNPSWSLDVFVSRKVVFHSFSLVAAGVYLLVMAFAGYAIQVGGGEWGPALQTVFLFGAGLVLVLVMLSGQLRARTRVFLSKHFYNYQYDYRDEWLRLTGALSEARSPEQLYQRSIQCIAQIVESRGGLLFVGESEGEGGMFTVAQAWKVEGEFEPVAATSPLVRFARQRRWIVDLNELREHPERYQGVEIPAALCAVDEAWLIVPLFHAEDLVGLLVLISSRAQRTLNWEDFDILKTASYQVASDVAQSLSAEALASAKQFEAYNRVSAFIMHDLKNVIGQLSLVTQNSKRLRHNEDFVDDAFQTVDNAVLRMKRLLNTLKQSRDMNLSSRVDLKPLVAHIVKERAALSPAPTLSASQEDCRVMGNPDRLASVIGNVIHNAQDATAATGFVRVSLYVELAEVVVSVQDNGTGMSREFVTKELFKPFVSTKGEEGMGIGAFEARDYVNSLGGRLTVDSVEGKGTLIKLRFPRVHTDTIEKVA